MFGIADIEEEIILLYNPIRLLDHRSVNEMAAENGLIKGAKAAGKALVKAGGVMALVELGTSLAQQGIDAGIKAHNTTRTARRPSRWRR